MAQAPLHVCPAPGCRVLIRYPQKRCPAHATPERTRSAAGVERQKLYNNRRWRERSAAHKNEHPLCEACLRQGRTTAVYATDHVIPHRGDLTLFWDESNWESACEACHNAKTARGE